MIQENLLILAPRNPAWGPENFAGLVDALKAIGFLGVERDTNLYSTGPEFLSLITYLGCSPQVSLGENEDATTIHLCGVFPEPLFLHGSNLKPPRCPHCRKTLGKQKLAATGEEELCCSHCGCTARAHEIDWRRSAAFCRVFIEISNVFESEAVPGEKLTACLEQASSEVWDYVYVRKLTSSRQVS